MHPICVVKVAKIGHQSVPLNSFVDWQLARVTAQGAADPIQVVLAAAPSRCL
jgi:hypothetical protein